MSDDGPSQEEFDALAAEVESLKSDYHATRTHKLFPKLDEHDDAIAALLDEVQSLKGELREVRKQSQRLEQQLESIAGLAEDEQSSPAKRTADLRQAMIRRAEAKEDDLDNPSASVALYYKEVQDLLADLGHGTVYKQQAFDAMEEAVNTDGFSWTHKHSAAGNRVKAVVLNLDALPAYAVGNDITTATDDQLRSDSPTHVTSSTQD